MKVQFLTLITVLMILTFALPLSAQKRVPGNISSFAEDTAMFPHDFNDEYYAANGIFAPLINGRRTGTDFLSVFGESSNPAHRNVRVLVTLPAYNENGEVLFWTPLGDLNDKCFTDDVAGAEAREMAAYYPIYVFPKIEDPTLVSFANIRQAALIDETQTNIIFKNNRLGLRMVFLVNFTEKAFSTKEGYLMLQNLGKKNGLSLEGTPLIKFKYEIDELAAQDFISIEKRAFRYDPPYTGLYTISPIIRTDTGVVPIARDAFLFMVTRNGQPLPDEKIFVDTFEYLQKIGVPPYDSGK